MEEALLMLIDDDEAGVLERSDFTCHNCKVGDNCGPECEAGQHCDVCNDHCLVYDMKKAEDGSELCESCFRIQAMAEAEHD